jgi:hypothetical protein
MQNNSFYKSQKFWGYLALSVIICGYLFFVIPANLDLSEGAFSLFMDERITFNGVRNILHPQDFKSFLYAIIDGNDQRYGRSLWNSIALVSFLPERLWGETGQIIAGRMLQVFLLITSFSTLSWTFVKNWVIRIILIIYLMFIPFTDYYMVMPKPEPLQLFFLSFFLYYYKKENLNFGWHWILLGLGFGTKISILPVVLLLFVASSWVRKKDFKNVYFNVDFKKYICFFFLGLGIAVPILLKPILISILILFIIIHFRIKSKIVVLCAYALSLLIIFFYSYKNIAPHILLNITHGADQDSINVFSWLDYVFNSWFIAPRWIAVLFIISLLGFIFTTCLNDKAIYSH